MIQRRVKRTALAITKSPDLAAGLVEDVAMEPQEVEMISDLSEKVCAQYQVLGQHAPAFLLAVMVAGYGGRTVLTFRKLEDLARIEAKRRAAMADKPAPAKIEQLPSGAGEQSS